MKLDKGDGLWFDTSIFGLTSIWRVTPCHSANYPADDDASDRSSRPTENPSPYFLCIGALIRSSVSSFPSLFSNPKTQIIRIAKSNSFYPHSALEKSGRLPHHQPLQGGSSHPWRRHPLPSHSRSEQPQKRTKLPSPAQKISAITLKTAGGHRPWRRWRLASESGCIYTWLLGVAGYRGGKVLLLVDTAEGMGVHHGDDRGGHHGSHHGSRCSGDQKSAFKAKKAKAPMGISVQHLSQLRHRPNPRRIGLWSFTSSISLSGRLNLLWAKLLATITAAMQTTRCYSLRREASRREGNWVDLDHLGLYPLAESGVLTLWIVRK